MAIIIVGTMAFDTIDTPHGKIDKAVGGSATYAAYAASTLIKPVQQISIIGEDFPQEELNELDKRGVQLDGVEVVKGGKSFYWSGRYHANMNDRDTLITDLNVLADFDPIIPDSYQGADYLFLGNVVPALQMSVIKQLKKRPKMIALDTMNFWMDTAMNDLKKVLRMIDVLIINDSEARQLSGENSLHKAANKIQEMGPEYLVIKKGEHGALLFKGDLIFSAPALPMEEVFDPTGAGDTFAGGFMGYMAYKNEVNFENMKAAIIYGSSLASFCVEKFGVQKLREISKSDIDNRLNGFIKLSSFNVQL